MWRITKSNSISSMTKKMKLTIGELSRYCQVTVKTLRHYEKLGLLVPNEVDEWTRYRYYDMAQVQRLNAILRLKGMGFTLEEIRDLLDDGSQRPSIQQVDTKIHEVEEQISRLQQRLELLRRMDAWMRHVADMDRFSICTLPSIIVASHRRKLKHLRDLTPLCANVIGPEIQRLGCKRTQPIYCFSIDYGKEFKKENVDIEYCEQVEEMHDDTPLIKFKRLPEVPMAVCMKCGGPYDMMPQIFIELFKYITDHGYHVAGPPRIQYVEGPWNQEDPAKWLTIIQSPVTQLLSRDASNQ